MLIFYSKDTLNKKLDETRDALKSKEEMCSKLNNENSELLTR